MSMLKPDYIDIDGDGNKTESMKEAAKQAESSNGREQAFFGGLKKKMRAMKEKVRAQQNQVPEPLELKPSTPNILGMSFMPLQGYAEGGDVEREQKAVGGLILRLGTLATRILKKSPLKKSKKNSFGKTKQSDAIDKPTIPATYKDELVDEMIMDAEKLRARGFKSDRIYELLEEAYDLGETTDLIQALKQPILKAKEILQEAGHLGLLELDEPSQGEDEKLSRPPKKSKEVKY